jgi:acyl carrier protein
VHIVREIIADIKEMDASEIADDEPLFSQPGMESAVQLDSLDALDLALALKERFDPDGDSLESLLGSDFDSSALATVNQVTDYIHSRIQRLPIAGSEQPVSS